MPEADRAIFWFIFGDPAFDVPGRYQTAGGILDTGLRYRVQRLWELREFEGMDVAIRYEDQHEFDDALGKLRRGPILNATTRRDTAIWQPPAG